MATPTEKSPEINTFISDQTGKDRVETITTDKCMTCDNDATEFRDECSEREYRISGMCQKCQDDTFGV